MNAPASLFLLVILTSVAPSAMNTVALADNLACDKSLSQDGTPLQGITEDRPVTQLAGLIGYGTVDGHNLGFGYRVGAALPSGFYFGGTLVYHAGTSETVFLDIPTGPDATNVSLSSLYVGVELGSDTRLSDDVLARPYAGSGYFVAMAHADRGDGVGGSEGRFYVAPGVLLNAYPSEQTTIGVDVRYVLVAGKGGGDASSFGIFLAVGLILQ